MEQTCLILFGLLALLTLSQDSPLNTSLMILLLAVGSSGLIWVSYTKWAGAVLALVFVGGMMVVFLYISSLEANMKLTWSPWMGVAPLMLFTSLKWAPETSGFPSISTWLIFGQSLSLLSVFLGVFLILALVLITKLGESFKGSLATKF